jgi:hypothetical protein
MLEFPCLTLRPAQVRQRVVHVEPSWRLRWDQIEDGRVDTTGCIRPDYPYFTVFYVLGHRGMVVF